MIAMRCDEHLDISDEIASGCRVVALVVISAVAMIAIGLWAINRPTHPSICGDLRGAECVAATQGGAR